MLTFQAFTGSSGMNAATVCLVWLPHAALVQRFKDARTGACIAARVIDDGAIATAYYCADPKSQRPYHEHTAFEIGSATKTMIAALLAD